MNLRKTCFFFLLVILSSCEDNRQRTLHIFTWSEMLDTRLVHEFEKEFNCHVVIDLYDSNESMYAKVKLGNSSYDILFPSNYYLEIMSKQGMVKPLNFDLIPNHLYLDPHYFNSESDPYGIPFMLSYSGLGYRSDQVAPPPSSYNIFGSKEYIGRMTMLNDTREALGAALRTLGHSVNSTDKNAIESAADLVIKWKQNLAKFESEQYKNGLINSEFLICQSYSSDILQVQVEADLVKFSFPKEGAILSIDYITISEHSPEPELAHAFINYMIAPKAAALNIQRTHALTPIPSSYQLLPKHLRENPILFPSEDQLKAMEKIRDLGSDVRLYYDAWERVKGS